MPLDAPERQKQNLFAWRRRDDDCTDESRPSEDPAPEPAAKPPESDQPDGAEAQTTARQSEGIPGEEESREEEVEYPAGEAGPRRSAVAGRRGFLYKRHSARYTV